MEDEFSFIDDGEIVDPGESRESSRISTQFQKGQSGNPQGRPRGSRNRSTLAAEALLDGEAEVLIRKVIESAKDGDRSALRLCFERLLPVRRSRPVLFDLPDTSTPEGILAAHDAVLAAVATGEVTPEEAQIICGLIDIRRRAFDACELERRVSALEHYQEGLQ